MKVTINPIGTKEGTYRVMRGGCWGTQAQNCRSAYRRFSDPGYRFAPIGFRLVLDGDYVDCNIKPGDKQMSMNFVYVGGGMFRMGSRKSEEDRYSDEKRHTVFVGDFFIKDTLVTNKEWYAVMGSYLDGGSNEKANYPVVNVSWDDCQVFINKLNEKTGLKFRLPSEAEWEYVAKGGHMMPYNKKGIHVEGFKYAGSDNLDEVGWYNDNSGNVIHPVAQKKPNQLGLYDMSGNVWEWCQDWYDANYANNVGSNRVLRGGCWWLSAGYCRSAHRSYNRPAYRHNYYGFRLVLNLQG